MLPDATEFEQALATNLALFTQPNSAPDANLFQVGREISLARLALSNQAHSYYRAISILNNMLNAVEQEFENNGHIFQPEMLRNIMTALSSIEARSKSLIDSVKAVTSLVKEAVNIDVDKASLRTLLVNMPSMIEKTVEKVSGDSQLAKNISISLNNEISGVMMAFRFDESGFNAAASPNNPQQGINIDQFKMMCSSVPTQPSNSNQIVDGVRVN